MSFSDACDLAFHACQYYYEGHEYGYGPAREFEFLDGSRLVVDGNGFSVCRLPS
jgi:hypothetical protein